MGNWFRLSVNVFDLVDHVSTDIASMATSATSSVEAGEELQYSPQYRVEDYIQLHITEISALRLAIMPTAVLFFMHAVS